jgi:hypothetical protein
MDQAREQRIRERAYFIWKREGCPEGRHLVHWRLATEDIERQDRSSEWWRTGPDGHSQQDRWSWSSRMPEHL